MSTRPAATAALSACAILTASLTLAAAAPASTSWRWNAATVVDYARLAAADISSDGHNIVYVASRPRKADSGPGPNFTNLWVVPFDGGAARRLTTADAEDKAPAWSPDGTRVAFLRVLAEDKAKTRLLVMPTDGGEPVPLTDEKVDVDSFAWSPDGKSLAYLASDPKSEAREKEEKIGRDWKVADQDPHPRRIWLIDPATKTAKVVAAAGERSIWQFAWSPDGASIVATASDTPKIDDSYMRKRIVILPVGREGAARELVGIVGKVDQVVWSKDGETIAYRAGVDDSDPYSGSVFVVPAAGGAPVNLTGGHPESVHDIVWMSKGKLVVVTVTGTRASLVTFDTHFPDVRRTLIEPGALAFTGASAAKNGQKFALTASTLDGPAEVYAGEHGTGNAFERKRLTTAAHDLDGLPRGKQETFTYAAKDGMTIEGVLIRPVGYPAHGSYPLVVIVHGGPESQYLDGWNLGYAVPGQALAERGYFVLYPNYRGSTGRGVAFAKADHEDLGGKEFTDVLDGIDALAAKFPIDKKRVGITGGSYGGYFTALGVTRYSDRFAAGVFLFGITNWISFLGESDIPVENSKVHWALWCYDHVEACWQASPIGNIQKAATPTLLFQGEADPRVPKPQSDELYAALKWKGVPAEYVLFPREKHGFRERAHQIETFDRMLAWFDKYLRP